MKKTILFLTLLVVLNSSLSLNCETGELSLNITPSEGTTDTTFRIDYALNVTQSIGNFSLDKAEVSFYLMPLDYDLGYFRLNFSYYNMIDRIWVNLVENNSFTFKWDEKGAYRVYASVYAPPPADSKYRYNPCIYERSILIHQEKEVSTVERIVEREYEDLVYSVANTPTEVYLNEPFYVVLNITNYNIEGNMQIYSYVYEGLNVLSRGWIHNRVYLNIQRGSNTEIVLQDKVVRGEEGNYRFRVRIKANDKNYDYTQSVKLRIRDKGNLTVLKDEIANNTLYFSVANYNKEPIDISFLTISENVTVINRTVAPQYSFVFSQAFNKTLNYFLFENGVLTYFNTYEVESKITKPNITYAPIVIDEEKNPGLFYAIISLISLVLLLVLLKFVS